VPLPSVLFLMPVQARRWELLPEDWHCMGTFLFPTGLANENLMGVRNSETQIRLAGRKQEAGCLAH
jgi:hypothetical protein